MYPLGSNLPLRTDLLACVKRSSVKSLPIHHRSYATPHQQRVPSCLESLEYALGVGRVLGGQRENIAAVRDARIDAEHRLRIVRNQFRGEQKRAVSADRYYQVRPVYEFPRVFDSTQQQTTRQDGSSNRRYRGKVLLRIRVGGQEILES